MTFAYGSNLNVSGPGTLKVVDNHGGGSVVFGGNVQGTIGGPGLTIADGVLYKVEPALGPPPRPLAG